MGNCLEFDRKSDVDASLVLLIEALERTVTDKSYWKSAVIFAFLCLRGVVVNKLTKSDGTGALSKRGEKELRRYHNFESQKAVNANNGIDSHLDDLEYPDERLASLKELLKRLSNGQARNLDKNEEQLTESEYLLRFLVNRRNEFSHFSVDSISTSEGDLIASIRECLTFCLDVLGPCTEKTPSLLERAKEKLESL